jgi:hypothetical protein
MGDDLVLFSTAKDTRSHHVRIAQRKRLQHSEVASNGVAYSYDTTPEHRASIERYREIHASIS